MVSYGAGARFRAPPGKPAPGTRVPAGNTHPSPRRRLDKLLLSELIRACEVTLSNFGRSFLTSEQSITFTNSMEPSKSNNPRHFVRTYTNELQIKLCLQTGLRGHRRCHAACLLRPALRPNSRGHELPANDQSASGQSAG